MIVDFLTSLGIIIAATVFFFAFFRIPAYIEERWGLYGLLTYIAVAFSTIGVFVYLVS